MVGCNQTIRQMLIFYYQPRRKFHSFTQKGNYVHLGLSSLQRKHQTICIWGHSQNLVCRITRWKRSPSHFFPTEVGSDTFIQILLPWNQPILSRFFLHKSQWQWMACLGNCSDVHKETAWHYPTLACSWQLMSGRAPITATEVQKFWIFLYQTIWKMLQQTPQQMSLVLSHIFSQSNIFWIYWSQFEINVCLFNWENRK